MATCEQDFLSIFQDAVKFTLASKFPEITKLKAKQEEALYHFFKRKDVFAVLPTGCGKSLLFQVVPEMCSYLHNQGLSYPKNSIMVVICPLNSLIDAHLKDLSDRGIKVCSLSEGQYDEQDLLSGKYSVIFTNPESLVLNDKWRVMLKSKVYQENMFGMVADEAHVVPKWGKGNLKEKTAAFRESFFRIGDLRSLLPERTPVLALTATATLEVKKDTLKGLGMRSDTHHVSVSPDRPNIYLYRAQVDKNLNDTFGWLIETLKFGVDHTPRTIIYCKSQKDCGQLFKHFKLELGSFAYFPDGAPHVSANMLIGMYHANTLQRLKERVSHSLFEEQGTCRVVFASTALGMGVNLPDVKQVIHYGPPRNIEDFVQEIGRAGRNGEPANSILYFTGAHLRKCEHLIKQYARSESVCLRKILLEKINETPSNSQERHNCCIVCHQQCSCKGSSCSVHLPAFNSGRNCTEVMPKRERTVKHYQKDELRGLLEDYQANLEDKCSAYGHLLSSETTTGFSNALINSVMQTCKFLFTVDDIADLNPIFKRKHATDVLHMVRDVFEDFELDKSCLDDVECVDDSSVLFDLEYGGIYVSESDTDDSVSVHSNSSDMSGVMEL